MTGTPSGAGGSPPGPGRIPPRPPRPKAPSEGPMARPNGLAPLLLIAPGFLLGAFIVL